jgi:hypothetical protein
MRQLEFGMRERIPNSEFRILNYCEEVRVSVCGSANDMYSPE